MYKRAGLGSSGECPILPAKDNPPYGAGRFGCWTCTVVRRDRAMQALESTGDSELRPLIHWKKWLLASRDLPSNRWKRRRNGAPGPGPLTLGFRRHILQRLHLAEAESGFKLISRSELKQIYRLWREDGARI